MPFLEAIKLALGAILGHKLRSFLTLLGVIFGVATVIVVVSLVEGFNAPEIPFLMAFNGNEFPGPATIQCSRDGAVAATDPGHRVVHYRNAPDAGPFQNSHTI